MGIRRGGSAPDHKRPLGTGVLTILLLLIGAVAAFAAGLFTDDDGNPHEGSIEAIAEADITRGCNPAGDRFCPEDPVTRGQMAALLNRALDLPASTNDRFTDDDDSIFEADIQAIAAAGITLGCNPTGDLFCPGDNVTRGQMAAFITRAFDLADSTNDRFTDDDDSIFEADIQAVAAAGITLGCSADRFCPDALVTRAQMASFLARALDLPIPVLDPGPGVDFTAGGDIGAESATTRNLEVMAAQKGDFFLALGDLSYRDVEPESAWCDYMKGHLGASFPIQVVVGNHEDDDRDDGYIGNFAACLPDRMGSTGVYGAEYYFDVEGLVRVIMIGADNSVDGVLYDYEAGNARYQWLSNTIDDARASGIRWVVVGMHKVCLTAGRKPCDIGADLASLLVDKRVDLVLSGHDHTYQRSKQLDCVVVGSYDPSCVVDDGSDGVYTKGDGTVFVVSGVMGHDLYRIDPGDPEYPYFVVTLGNNSDQPGHGFLKVNVTANALSAWFVGTTTDFTDSFVIR